MKNLLFQSVSAVGGLLITSLHAVGTFLVLLVQKIFTSLIWIIANACKIILSVVDSERVEYAKQAVLQSSMTLELEILSAITKVKEDAIERKFWTEDHSTALNVLGNKLFSECNWDEDRIHDYIRRVVESLPGLSYATGEDDDDEDEGIPIG